MKKFLLPLCFLVAGMLTAQDRIPAELSSSSIYLKLLSPSIAYELKLSSKQSAIFQGGFELLTDNDFENGSLNPFIQVDMRNYYPRKKVKRELRSNSGNYVGFIGGYLFEGLTSQSESVHFNDEKKYYFGGVWGMQRNYKSGIHWNLQLGPVIRANKHGAEGDLLIQFGFGFVIGE